MSLIYLVITILLLFCSAFFSASETALFSLNRFQIMRLTKDYPASGQLARTLLDQPRRTLITILIGNTLVNVLISAIATVIFINIFKEKGLGIAIVCITLVIIVFGEVTPKIFAIKNAFALSHILARPLAVFGKLIFPVRWVAKKIADFFVGAFIGKETAAEPYITEGELKTLISMGEGEGIINEDERQMISAVFEFENRIVSEIMVPRVDIIACDVNTDIETLARLMRQSKHQKIPIYEGTIDRITGYVETKEFLLNPGQDNIKTFIRPILFVPETKKINDLLLEFQSKKSYITVVIDEYGGTSGIATLEDILEEIVGDIQDEYDQEEKPFEAIDKNTIKFNADINLKEVDEQLKTYIRTSKVQTLAGLAFYLFGKVPSAGDSITYKDVILIINEVRGKRIKKITVKKIG